ncbi:MAG: type IX secretion system motor protein PorL/GldL [Flavobacteriales bacterium]
MGFQVSKKTMNMAYGLGAAVVIIGALMKIIHKDLDLGLFKISGNDLLTIGLVTEALIFALSAFDAPDEGYAWEKAFPVLIDEEGSPVPGPGPTYPIEADMLAKAGLDVKLVKSLGENINNLNSAAKAMVGSADASTEYSEHLKEVNTKMGSINSLYQAQIDSATRQAEITKDSQENATKLKEQMESLASNLSSLNGVYGGMLSAMNKK